MNDLISRKELLDLLDKGIYRSTSESLVDYVLTSQKHTLINAVLKTVKHAVEQMPTAEDNFCAICKWKELALEKGKENEDSGN